MYSCGTKEEIARMTASAFLEDCGWKLRI